MLENLQLNKQTHAKYPLIAKPLANPNMDCSETPALKNLSGNFFKGSTTLNPKSPTTKTIFLFFLPL